LEALARRLDGQYCLSGQLLLEDVGDGFSHIGRWPPDSSTIFGLGILAGVALFWWTGVPEVGLIAAAAVKILLPQHRPGEEENPLDVIEEVAETLA
jgi:hypothetical protein